MSDSRILTETGATSGGLGVRARLVRSEMPDGNCPNCGAVGLETFYEVDDIPVHSCLIMPSAAEAQDYPRGGLTLGHCRECGFITNTRFEPARHEYSTQYEETQGFSPTFNQFARSLAQRWIDRYEIRGKKILEIGCGKGEFLALMCELGGNHGIGFDPAFVPDRMPPGAAGRVEFMQDFYSEEYSDVEADVIVCRHTLEHIAPTLSFMQTVRRAVGERDTLILFDLPDASRVFAEGAFWDIYYEHCTYFTAGSLARLFRLAGFDVLSLERDYADQYLVLEARPASGPTAPRFVIEDDLEATATLVEEFGQRCGGAVAHWRQFLDDHAGRGEKIALWGSGSKAVSFLTTLGVTDEVQCVVDINPHRQGRYMPGTGHPIVGPDDLAKFAPDQVVIMNPVYREEINAELRRQGLRSAISAV